MAITKIGSCNYYGTLKGKLYGDNIGIFIVDEAYKRVLDKHEEKLAQMQKKMISELRLTFSDELRSLRKENELIAKRVSDIEKTITRRADEDKKT